MSRASSTSVKKTLADKRARMHAKARTYFDKKKCDYLEFTRNRAPTDCFQYRMNVLPFKSDVELNDDKSMPFLQKQRCKSFRATDSHNTSANCPANVTPRQTDAAKKQLFEKKLNQLNQELLKAHTQYKTDIHNLAGFVHKINDSGIQKTLKAKMTPYTSIFHHDKVQAVLYPSAYQSPVSTERTWGMVTPKKSKSMKSPVKLVKRSPVKSVKRSPKSGMSPRKSIKKSPMNSPSKGWKLPFFSY